MYLLVHLSRPFGSPCNHWQIDFPWCPPFGVCYARVIPICQHPLLSFFSYALGFKLYIQVGKSGQCAFKICTVNELTDLLFSFLIGPCRDRAVRACLPTALWALPACLLTVGGSGRRSPACEGPTGPFRPVDPSRSGLGRLLPACEGRCGPLAGMTWNG